jgi:OHCU decarboxylase
MSVAQKLDAMDEAHAHAALERCCGARRWVAGMLARRPFGTDEALHRAADEVWAEMERADIREAFAAHPRIGEDIGALRKRWEGQEQAGVAAASDQTLRRLRDGNLRYEERFGYIFIVCATGKGSDEMLAALEGRLGNDPAEELPVAAAEQAKIIHVRLDKL